MFKRLFARRGGGNGPGRGRMSGSRAGVGPGGECVCPNCGYRSAHQIAQPCYKIKCPQCGTAMRRA